MPFKLVKSLISSYIKEIIPQILEAELNGLDNGLTLDNLLLPDKNGKPILCKSYEEACAKPAPKKAEPKKAESKKAEPKKAKAKKTESKKADPKKEEIKKIIPVNISKNVILLLEYVFDKMCEFINIHQSLIVGKENPVKILSEIEDDFNIIAILNNVANICDDKHNLKHVKEDQFLNFMAKDQIVKINQREFIRIYTLFIIMLCNICIKIVINDRKKFTLTAKQLYFHFNVLSAIKNCEFINDIVKNFGLVDCTTTVGAASNVAASSTVAAASNVAASSNDEDDNDEDEDDNDEDEDDDDNDEDDE